jgi:hypothetical protein
VASSAAHAQPTQRMLLLARASVARRLVIDGALDGPLALSLAVEPTQRTQELERKVGMGTLTGRVYSYKGETA